MGPLSCHFISAFVFIATSIPLIGNGSARVWTDIQGRTIDAELMKSDDWEVVFRLANGKNSTVPLHRLSQADLDFIARGGRGAEGAEDDSPVGAGESKDDETLNWDDPWPDSVPFKADPEIEVIEENAASGRFVYESLNYRFTCDVRLSKSVVSTFADMFETTRLYCRALPLAITGGVKHNGKYDIFLFAEKDNYIKAGGPPSSAGVFIGGRNIVMVPLTSLGVRKVGSGYMRDRDKSDGTLIHELTHQLTPSVYFSEGARGWFSEGLAEYVTSTPYKSGRFKVKNNLDDIAAYATGYGKNDTRGRAMGEEFTAPDLKKFMLMSYAEFTGPAANFNYGFGMVITTYFMVLDGEGDAARLKEFLKELRRLGPRGDTAKAIDKLLDGRTFEQLQEDISKAWKRKGIEINFRD